MQDDAEFMETPNGSGFTVPHISLSLSLSLFVCCLFDWLKKGSIIKKKGRRIRKRERERADTKDKQSLDIVSLCWFFTTQHSIAHFSSVKQKQNN